MLTELLSTDTAGIKIRKAILQVNREKNTFLNKTWFVWIGAFLCCALWGSAFPCIKTGYALFGIAASDTASQILFAGIRFFFAGVLAILFGSIQSRKILIPRAAALPKILVLSLFQTILQYVLFYVGLANTTAVKGSIISGTSVFFSILVACIFLKNEKLNRFKILGCIIGFAGLVLVNINGAALALSVNLPGDSFMLISSVSNAFSALFIKIFTRTENTALLSGYQFLFGGAVMIVIGAAGHGRLQDFSASGVILLLYMALISSVAYTLWGILIKYNSVSRICVFGFLTPVMGVLLSALFLRETDSLGVLCVVALFLVCAGIWLVNRDPDKNHEVRR